MKTQESKKKKKQFDRSPRYPSMSLRVAINNIRELHEKEGRALVPREVAVKAWGYKSLHGSSLTQLAAVAQYGLLHREKGKVGISEDAFIILEAPSNSSEKKAALERCSREPRIFSEISQNHPKGLPSDDTLKWELRQKNFTEQGAEVVIACLRDTISFVEEELKDNNVANQQEKEEIQTEPKPPMKTETTTQHVSCDISGQTQVTGTLTINARDWVFPLDKGSVCLSWKNIDPTPDIIEGLQDYLEVSKKRLKREKPELNTDSD